MLTEAEINKIKREIGDVFRRVLQQAEVKLILKKPPHMRKEEEFDKLVKFLMKYDYLTQQKNLQYSEMRELAQLLTYEEYEPGQQIYNYGEEPENFYMVLKGHVSI